MNQVSQIGFDYGQLQAVDAAEVRAASERIKLRMNRLADDIVAIGQDLIATKQRLGHGQFGEWIKAEFDMGHTTAVKMMQVAEKFGGKFAQVENLNPSILYQLAAPSTPDEVVARTIEARQAGEQVTTADVKRWKEEAQQAKAEAEAARIAKQQADSKVEQLARQQQDALDRLERAREEYRKLQNRAPEVVEIIKQVEVVPAPYISLDQALEGKRNLLSEAERDVEKAKRELGRIQTDIIKARQDSDKAENERTHIERHRAKLATLKNGLVGFMQNYQESFMAIESSYIQYAESELLMQIEERLRAMADKLAEVRGHQAEYAEFEVVV